MSFGATDWVRDQMGTNGAVNKCSGAYNAGEWAGIGYGLAAGGTGLAKAGFRAERGRWKQGGNWVVAKGKTKWHFHYGRSPGLGKHHLPYQSKNWWNNFKANMKRGEGGNDLANSAFATYGFGVAGFGASGNNCECQ